MYYRYHNSYIVRKLHANSIIATIYTLLRKHNSCALMTTKQYDIFTLPILL